MTTKEPDEYILAQVRALTSGRKPAVLITEGELFPEVPGVQMEVLPEGLLLFFDSAVLKQPLGLALGYGIDHKPDSNLVLTVREESGQIIHEVITDGRPEVEEAGRKVAGTKGSIEYRHILHSMLDRHGSVAGIVEALYG